LESEDGLDGFGEAVAHDGDGDVSTFGEQFVLELGSVGFGQVDLAGMAAGAAELFGGGGDAVVEGHRCIVPVFSGFGGD